MNHLDNLPPELIYARGQYATIRALHEDAKSRMSVLSGAVGSITSKVLFAVQPKDDSAPDFEHVQTLLSQARATLDQMDALAGDITELAKQRADLKDTAWPKGGNNGS